jgi:cobalt-zinc-cadmium resistance protein CzcA
MDFLLDNRWLVFGMVLVLIAGGLAVMVQLPIEAFPDLTNNQVVVTVQCPGMSPVEVEQLVTYPIETAMMGMPKLQTVRSTSKLELSMVTIIFDDSMDGYLVRQLVAERLSQVRSHLRAEDDADADQDAAGLGDSIRAAGGARRNRDQLMGR